MYGVLNKYIMFAARKNVNFARLILPGLKKKYFYFKEKFSIRSIGSRAVDSKRFLKSIASSILGTINIT